jgi:hypothetical protein
MEIGSRRVVRISVTEHPTAEWTMQQLREAIPSEHSYRFLIHDRHATFSTDLDEAGSELGDLGSKDSSNGRPSYWRVDSANQVSLIWNDGFTGVDDRIKERWRPASRLGAPALRLTSLSTHGLCDRPAD